MDALFVFDVLIKQCHVNTYSFDIEDCLLRNLEIRVLVPWDHVKIDYLPGFLTLSVVISV